MGFRAYRRVGILLVFIIIMATAEGFGQQRMPEIDFQQFREDVANIDSPDEKLNRYVAMSLKVVRSSPDSLFSFAKEVENMFGLDESKRKAFSKFILANGWRAFNRDSAISYGTQAAKLLKKIDEHDQYLRAQNLLGLEYRKNSDYLKAETAFLEGLHFSQASDSTSYPIQYFYGNLGNLYSAVGAHHLAVDMFEQFMEYADNPSDRCNIKSRLAANLLKLEEFEKAEQMLVPCLDYPDIAPPIQAIIRANLSEIVEKMGQNAHSLSLMEQAAAISTKYKIPNLHIWHLVRLGNQYVEFGRIQQADSIRNVIKNADFRGINRHFRIEKALFLSGLAFASGEYEKSIALADSAINIAGETELQRFLKTAYDTKASAHEKLGNMDLAVENLRLQDQLDERQHSLEEIKKEALMKVRYQLKNSEEQLAAVSSELNILSSRNVFLIMLTIVLCIAAGYIFNRYRNSKAKEKKAASELQKNAVTISELEQKIQEQNSKLSDRNIPDWITINSQVKLSLDEIRYIESEGNYVKIFLSDPERAPLIERLTLKECEEMMPDELSLRIHRSTIVNLRHVSYINNEILYLKDNTRLKISRRYKKELINFLN